MVVLRSMRNLLSLQTFDDVSRALAFLYRATQDAITALEKKRPTTVLEAGGPVNYGDRVLVRSGTIVLPSALARDRETVELTNNGSGAVTVEPRINESIQGSTAVYSLATLTTVKLTSDGRGGWWA